MHHYNNLSNITVIPASSATIKAETKAPNSFTTVKLMPIFRLNTE